MNENYQIGSVEQPDWDAIGGGIHNFNIQQAGEGNDQTMCFVIKGPDEEIVGGVIAATHWDWLYIDLMWIKEEVRGLGYGQRLLELAEEKARQLGAKNAYLDTFSFQAPDFYKKFGYQVFGELKMFPVGHQRYYLNKKL
jgi:GNAT superfamily N-acetyltransferase